MGTIFVILSGLTVLCLLMVVVAFLASLVGIATGSLTAIAWYGALASIGFRVLVAGARKAGL